MIYYVILLIMTLIGSIASLFLKKASGSESFLKMLLNIKELTKTNKSFSNELWQGEKMKRFISIVIMAALSIALFSACGKKGESYNVYFREKQGNKLSSEERFVGSDLGAKNIAKILIAEMEKGPQNEKNERLLPKGTKLLSIAIKNEVATLNFSKQYSKSKGVDALLLRFSVVNTLCGIKGIKG